MKGALLYLFDYFAGNCELLTVVIMFFSVFVIIFLCFPIHECAHALAAKILGDDTAERQGRITLNPLAHIDPMGAICMCICCIGWAKPTPVDLRNCRKVSMRAANVLVSLAGPLSNIVLALIVMIIYKIMIAAGAVTSETAVYIMLGLNQIIQINIFLGIFNLIPIPPFDGYHILASFLPAKAVYFMERNGQIINFVVLLLLISNVLDAPLMFLENGVWSFLDLITRFIC
ncbi:MAG: site-2 protease family protein [Lachnospiraceae bacterium]|nr:site-2 protease family protein [Ruminococcus sp.]MCM1274207.1 site-2 protease family protein [Lachnospiraceae bacterium]